MAAGEEPATAPNWLVDTFVVDEEDVAVVAA